MCTAIQYIKPWSTCLACTAWRRAARHVVTTLAAIACVWSVALASAAAQGIPVAYIGPLGGPPGTSTDAQALRAGIEAHFADVNTQGGVNGHKLALATFDDRYDGKEFTLRFEEAMQRKPVALLSPLGLAAMRALLDGGLLDRHDVVVINAVPGATAFRSPGHPKLFHVRAGDRQQIEKMLRHFQTLGMLKVDVLVQNLRIGEPDVREALGRVPGHEALKLQLREVALSPPAIAAAAAEVAGNGAQAVLVLGSPPFMAQSVEALRKAGVTRPVFALSYLQPGLLLQTAGIAASRGVSIAQTFPDPNGQALALQRDFQASMRRHSPQLKSYVAFHLEGYLSARVLTEALRRTSGPPTPVAVANALRLAPLNFGGFGVDFRKGNTGSNFVDIAVIAPSGRLMY